MLKNTRLTVKFPILMIVLALASALATGMVAFHHTKSAMQGEAKEKLFSLLESREASLRNYFETVQQDVSFHTQNPMVLDGIKKFTLAWSDLPAQKTQYLHRHYIDLNPFGLGLKEGMVVADDDSQYSNVHGLYHPLFVNLKAARKFYDVLLISPNGDIVYSAGKELDFATNLNTGPWRQSKLAQIFQSLNDSPSIGLTAISDFEHYAPSAGIPASFIASAIFDKNHQYLGVLAFQMPIEPLNQVMQVTAGMGETGETYLVGEDLTMRSDSRFYPDQSIMKRVVDTESTRLGLQGESGVRLIQDYRGLWVYSAFKPIYFLGNQWVVLAEVDEEEVNQAVVKLNKLLTISGIIIMIAITFLGYLLAVDLAQPIVSMTNVMSRLSKNDLSVNISVPKRNDEVGHMADAIIHFKEHAIERERLKENLTYMVQHDTLTGLPNRDFALKTLKGLLQEAKITDSNFIVMFADLDGFKEVNDEYGHNAGDHLLKEYASGFATCLRPGDMVARVGGDEFVFLLKVIDTRADSSLIANKVIGSIGTGFTTQNATLNVGVSIGIAVYPDDGRDSQTLLKRADEAMYTAKSLGKNQYCFAQTKLTGEEDLKKRARDQVS